MGVFKPAPIKALPCLCFSRLWRKNPSHPLRGWSVTHSNKPGVPLKGTPVQILPGSISLAICTRIYVPRLTLIESIHFQICTPFYSNAKFLSTFEPFFVKSGYFLSSFSDNSETTLPSYITARFNKLRKFG